MAYSADVDDALVAPNMVGAGDASGEYNLPVMVVVEAFEPCSETAWDNHLRLLAGAVEAVVQKVGLVLDKTPNVGQQSDSEAHVGTAKHN